MPRSRNVPAALDGACYCPQPKSCPLNALRDRLLSRRVDGKLFQADGPCNAKLRCPVDVLTFVNWIYRDCVTLDVKWFVAVRWQQMAPPCRVRQWRLRRRKTTRKRRRLQFELDIWWRNTARNGVVELQVVRSWLFSMCCCYSHLLLSSPLLRINAAETELNLLKLNWTVWVFCTGFTCILSDIWSYVCMCAAEKDCNSKLKSWQWAILLMLSCGYSANLAPIVAPDL